MAKKKEVNTILIVVGFFVIVLVVLGFIRTRPTYVSSSSQDVFSFSTISWPLNPNIESPKGDSIFPEASGGDLKAIYTTVQDGRVAIKIKLYEPNSLLLRYFININQYKTEEKNEREKRYSFLLVPQWIDSIPKKENVIGTSTLYYSIPEGSEGKTIQSQNMGNDPSRIMWKMNLNSDEIIFVVPLATFGISEETFINKCNVKVVVQDPNTGTEDLQQFER